MQIRPLQKAGVVLSEITSNTLRQDDLFAEPQLVEESKLMAVLDSVNERFGRGVLRISSQDAGQEWGMRQERKSPAYTTNWDDVPVAT